MAILRIKLVESLSKDRYLREDKIDISGLQPNEKDAILDTVRDSNDIGEINLVADTLKVSDKLKAPIVRSIIKYRSIDEKVNPIIQIYNNFGGDSSKITEDQLFTFYNVLNKVPMTHSDISKYFNPDTDILESKDLNYLVTLVAHLSDRYTARKYKNDAGDIPNIEAHLMNEDKKFKPVAEIKRLMDAFTTEDSNVDKIDLQDWFENNKIRPEDLRNFLLDLINNQKIDKPDNFDAAKLADYIKNLYLPDNAKTRSSLMLKVKLRKDSSKDDLKELSSIIDLLNNALTYSAKSDIGFSINDILQDNGAITFTEKIKLLLTLIDKFDGKPASKVSAKYKLNQLKDKKNENLYILLMNTQLPDADIDSLSRALEKFLKEKINQNYLYTTIAEAMALSGKLPAQGHKFLAHYLLNMKSDAKNNYLDTFNKVWNNKNLLNQLLNARITRTSSGAFNWVKAITDFLNDIKI